MGTLIVSYQTDIQGQRLDRIRFWLINDKKEQTLYPKKNEFVAHSSMEPERTVVISHLPAGRYTIQFLVPNADDFFESINPRRVQIRAGEIVKIEQEIRLRHHTQQISLKEEIAMLTLSSSVNKPHTLLNYIVPPTPILRPIPYSSLPPPQFTVTNFSLKNNMQTEWKLMRRGRIIYSNVGSISNFPLPVGRNYYIIAQPIPGYTVRKAPQGFFDADPGKPIQAEIYYQREVGYLTIESVWLSSQPLSFTIYPQDRNRQEPISLQIEPNKGMIFWQSGPMAVGDYFIDYKLPTTSSRPQKQKFTIFRDQYTLLNPELNTEFNMTGSLEILTDARNAIFTLKKQDGTLIGQGKGEKYTFTNLEPGYYDVSFSSSDPQSLIAPSTQRVLVNNNQSSRIKTSYVKAEFKEKVSTSTENLSHQSKTGILVRTNVNESQFTVEATEPNQVLRKSKFKGKSVFVPLETAGLYRIIFDPVPNYETPSPITIRSEIGQQIVAEVTYKLGNNFVEVPAGEAIIGDPFNDSSTNRRPAKTVYIPAFAIGTYEVTNAEFARWLNQAWQQRKVFWHVSLKGHIVDSEGALICRTMEGHVSSQILAQKGSSDPIFVPLPGKENYPVIQVSWYGANLYCRDLGYRLPKEDEWEKAAGMALSKPNGKLKRYKFGFGSDTIDRTWANYKVPFNANDPNQVATTPVGFYNGINTLPLTIQDREMVITHDARSPVGAYDMSGNVWEWVASWDDEDPSETKKVIKGGCYDSSADGVRISERLSLPPEHADIYTGFRAAKDLMH